MPKRCEPQTPENQHIRRSIGRMLKAGRTAADLSQAQAALFVGLGHRTTVAKHESGQREPTPAQLCRYGRLYRTPPGSYLAFACAGVDGDELEALTRNEIHFATALIELAEQITDPTERLHVLRGVQMTARKYAYPRIDRPGSRFWKWT